MRRFLLVGFLAACSTADIPEPVTLSTMEKLDSLRREFAWVDITSDRFGEFVVVTLPSTGQHSNAVRSLPVAIEQLFAATH